MTDLEYCYKTLLPFGINISIEDVLSDSRDEEICLARVLYSFILRKNGYKLSYIAVTLNRRTHSGVLLNLSEYSTRPSHIKKGYAERFEFITRELINKTANISVVKMIRYHEDQINKLRKLV